MIHVHSLNDVRVTRPAVLTIGAFDGVHLGHQALIGQLVAAARAADRTPAVLTFHPHPRQVLQGPQPGFYLTLPDEKAELLARYGVELVITQPFDRALRETRARDFVLQLKERLALAGLWVGPDFALGYQREGNVALLRALGAELGYTVDVIAEKQTVHGEVISSGRVRAALAGGDVALASALLGRFYAVSGRVVAGQHRGRAIGIPTANLEIPEDRAIPARGVYATWAWVAGERHHAVTNVGVRPTFDGQSAVTVEAHLLGFSADLYGQTLALDFVARLREERRFSSAAELVAQIGRDITAGRERLAETPSP